MTISPYAMLMSKTRKEKGVMEKVRDKHRHVVQLSKVSRSRRSSHRH